MGRPPPLPPLGDGGYAALGNEPSPSTSRRRASARAAARTNFEAEFRATVLESFRSGSIPNFGTFTCTLIFVFLLTMGAILFGIYVTYIFMFFRGILWTLSWMFSFESSPLSTWLLLLQVCCTAEVFSIRSFRSPSLSDLAEKVLAPCEPCGINLSFILKAAWCLVAGHIATVSPEDDKDFKKFMLFYSQIFILRLMVVRTSIQLLLWYSRRAVQQGRISTARGAGPDPTSVMALMKEVPYSRERFTRPNDIDDSHPLNECCICLEEYSSEMSIISTPCDHIMHRDCLNNWLHWSHFCPLCRTDLSTGLVP